MLTGMQCYVTPTVCEGKPVMSGKKQVWQSDSLLSHMSIALGAVAVLAV